MHNMSRDSDQINPYRDRDGFSYNEQKQQCLLVPTTALLCSSSALSDREDDNERNVDTQDHRIHPTRKIET